MSRFVKSIWVKISSLESKSLKVWLKKYWLPFFLLVCFAILLRPYLNEKISNNNHNLIITLTTVENWLDEGAGFHNYNLIHSWGNLGDKGIHYYPRVMNENGRNYFVSYPPFSFILFYAIVKVVQPNNLVVFFKVFGAIIHCLTFFVIFSYLRRKINVNLAVLLAGLFLFSPSSIVLSNMYYPEQLVLLLLVILVFIHDLYKGKFKAVINFILGFLLVYSDWLGFLVIASFGFYKLFFERTNKKVVDFTFLFGGILGGCFFVLQYSWIDGIDGLIQGMKVRYLERSGVFYEKYSDRGVNLFNSNSIFYLKTHLLPSIIGIFTVLFLLKPKIKLSNNRDLFWIVFLPICLHMIFLFNSNILHFQNLSKLSLLLTIGIMFLISFPTISKAVSFGLLSLYICSSTFITTSYFQDYSTAKLTYKKADFIKPYLDKNIPIVMIQEEFTEDLVLLSYLLKRNVIFKPGIISVKKLLNKNHKSAVCIDWENKLGIIVESDFR